MRYEDEQIEVSARSGRDLDELVQRAYDDEEDPSLDTPVMRRNYSLDEEEDEPAYVRRTRIDRDVIRVKDDDNELENEDVDIDELLPEPELSEEERAALEEKRRRRAERRQKNIFRQLYSGEILTKDEVRALYPYLMVLGLTFLLSMLVLFSALRLDINRTRLQNELKVLQEQSVRQSEKLYRATSRSAIIEQSKARGLNLEEMPTQTYIIDND
ncbi:MAG: hypothetical protein II315_02780 [Rikenellaceae bacterium]|jgi:hypothetical protein|nr:hypothetical protein [Rikenellaceae bacterium]